MTAITTARIVAAPKAYTFKGANKSVRDAALAGVASLAYSEGKSRADTIAQLRLALGNRPSDADVAATRSEYIVGRTAQRLAAPDLPKADMTVPDRITFARMLVLQYAAPSKDGVATRKLRKGQAGRRTISQHKVIRAAEEAWSLVKSELGIGQARTQAEKNAKARKPRMAGSSAAPSHSVLVSASDKVQTAESATLYISDMARTLLQFCNKHAKVVPTPYGQSVQRFAMAIAELSKA
jgi:hypothetical protein